MHEPSPEEIDRQFSLEREINTLIHEPENAISIYDTTQARLRDAYHNPKEKLQVELACKQIKMHPPSLWAALGIDTHHKVMPIRPGVEIGVDDNPIESIPVNSITAQAVQWLWYPYIPRGAITLLDGDPGVGKSFLTMAIAAAISMGRSLPDEQGEIPPATHEPRNVLFFASEDSLPHTVRPRYDHMDADLSRIFYVKSGYDGTKFHKQFTLDEPERLRRHMDIHKPAIVVIDPIQAYLGSKININQSNEVRPLMQNLASLAQLYNCSFLCLRHLSKGSGVVKTKSAMRGLGSVDFGGIARSILFADEHPLYQHKTVVLQVKSNVGQFGRTQIFSKAEGKFAWNGVTRLDERAIQGGEGFNALKAFIWLEQTLWNGMPRPAKDIETQGEEYGFTAKDLFRARVLLGATSKRVGGIGDQGYWEWHLPSLDIRHGYTSNLPGGQDQEDAPW